MQEAWQTQHALQETSHAYRLHASLLPLQQPSPGLHQFILNQNDICTATSQMQVETPSRLLLWSRAERCCSAWPCRPTPTAQNAHTPLLGLYTCLGIAWCTERRGILAAKVAKYPAKKLKFFCNIAVLHGPSVLGTLRMQRASRVHAQALHVSITIGTTYIEDFYEAWFLRMAGSRLSTSVKKVLI